MLPAELHLGAIQALEAMFCSVESRRLLPPMRRLFSALYGVPAWPHLWQSSKDILARIVARSLLASPERPKHLENLGTGLARSCWRPGECEENMRWMFKVQFVN